MAIVRALLKAVAWLRGDNEIWAKAMKYAAATPSDRGCQHQPDDDPAANQPAQISQLIG